MPITVHPSEQRLSSVNTQYRKPASDAKQLLNLACPKLSENCREIFQTSFTSGSANSSSDVSASAERFAFTDLSKSKVLQKSNGFVNTALQAYSSHHHLVIRPDDVWIAILSQFSLYVNANAKALRHIFVEHDGKKPLIVQFAVGSRYEIDFGKFAERMGNLMQKNVKDPELREWIIPKFSTTTNNDRIVSSVLMMATCKAYFEYMCKMTCGLPAVTLLGEKADWEKLLARAEKLPSYGEQTAQWHSLLKPVLAAFVDSFEKPDSKSTKDFWQTISHYTSEGCCMATYLSGWITAFCFFDKKGKPLYSDESVGQRTLWNGTELGSFDLDGVKYHRVEIEDIPPAYAEVDVKLDDNGVKIQTVMVAGLVGMEITSSGVRRKGHEGKDDTVQPVAGWWLFEVQPVLPESKLRIVRKLRGYAMSKSLTYKAS